MYSRGMWRSDGRTQSVSGPALGPLPGFPLLFFPNGEALPLNQGAVKLRRSSGRVAVRLRGDSRDWLRCAWLNRRIRGMNGCWRRWLRRRGWLRCRSWRMVSNWLESWLHSS